MKSQNKIYKLTVINYDDYVLKIEDCDGLYDKDLENILKNKPHDYIYELDYGCTYYYSKNKDSLKKLAFDFKENWIKEAKEELEYLENIII